MKYKHYVLFFFVLFFVINCKQKDSELELNYISSSLKKIKVSPNYKWVVVLPGLGCHGCIREAEYFIQDYIDNKEILFVLTKIESLKILQNKIELNVRDHDNIFIDKNGLFDLPTNNTIYPCIIGMIDGEMKFHEFQSPNNSDAFEKLKAKL